MPNFCIDVYPGANGIRAVHDSTPGRCSRLPVADNRENLGWHERVESALAKARERHASVRPCNQCCGDAQSGETDDEQDFGGSKTYVLDESEIEELDESSMTSVMRDVAESMRRKKLESGDDDTSLDFDEIDSSLKKTSQE